MIARDLIRKIRKIEIYTTRLVNDQLAGAYHSVFKGRGMAFEEVRQYQPGDDVRLIDWNVSARTNNVFVKLFVEEREMTVMQAVTVAGGVSDRGSLKGMVVTRELADGSPQKVKLELNDKLQPNDILFVKERLF